MKRLSYLYHFSFASEFNLTQQGGIIADEILCPGHDGLSGTYVFKLDALGIHWMDYQDRKHRWNTQAQIPNVKAVCVFKYSSNSFIFVQENGRHGTRTVTHPGKQLPEVSTSCVGVWLLTTATCDPAPCQGICESSSKWLGRLGPSPTWETHTELLCSNPGSGPVDGRSHPLLQPPCLSNISPKERKNDTTRLLPLIRSSNSTTTFLVDYIRSFGEKNTKINYLNI